MKPIYTFVLMLSSLLNVYPLLQAQDLSNLEHIAHWPLLTDNRDELQHLNDMETHNGPLDPVFGIFSNGIYPADDPENASYFRTPAVASLYDSVFAIQLQFRLGEYGQFTRPIVVLGEGYRWLGLQTRYDSIFIMLVNNDTHIEIPDVIPHPGVYYELTIIHDLATDETEVFLDGNLVLQFQIPLIRIEDDKMITNVNPSTGRAFHGYWRHLHIFGTEEISALRVWLEFGQYIQVHPNPAVDKVLLNTSWPGIVRYEILDDLGGQRMSGIIKDMHQEVNIQTLPAGTFFIRFFSENGIVLGSRKMVKVR